MVIIIFILFVYYYCYFSKSFILWCTLILQLTYFTLLLYILYKCLLFLKTCPLTMLLFVTATELFLRAVKLPLRACKLNNLLLPLLSMTARLIILYFCLRLDLRCIIRLLIFCLPAFYRTLISTVIIFYCNIISNLLGCEFGKQPAF